MKQSSRRREEDSRLDAGRATCEATARGGDAPGERESARCTRSLSLSPKRVQVSKLARISGDQGSRIGAGSIYTGI